MVNKIIYKNWIFQGTAIKSENLYLASSLTFSQLEADQFEALVECDDPGILKFRKHDPLQYIRQEGSTITGYSSRTFYLEAVERVGENNYRLTGTSSIGLLFKKPHAGGLYTGETVEAIVRDIFGILPVEIKTSIKDIRLYGWLPYANGKDRSARDNLVDVLFAIGAGITTDYNGTPRIHPLWDGASGAIPIDKIYQGVNVTHEPAVTEVRVTEHQYIPGSEVKTLFEGTPVEKDPVVFSEPMHSLSASGFSILESGANWARLSAGTGTLTGKTYIHTTREVTEPVTPDADENIKTESACTLVSLTNSRAVARRLAAYYACRETIDASILASWQSAGNVAVIYHPYEKKMIPACIASLDTNVSSVLKANTKLLAGFSPPQHDDATTYDRQIMLTGKGVFEVPQGVHLIRGVSIGAGQGGYSGLRGGEAPTPQTVSKTDKEWNTRKSAVYYVDGGAGGGKGNPGSGGKVYQFEIAVQPGEKISYNCGVGGAGGVYSASGTVAGSKGGDTTFGPYSSASGSVSAAGFLDPITGNTYATPGTAGINGGNGSGSGGQSNSETPVAGAAITYRGKTYTAGNATQTIRKQEYRIDRENSLLGGWSEGLGGGAAAGNNGLDGASSGSINLGDSRGTATGGSSGNGADAVSPPAQTVYGKGGDGGNGGGGAGSPGISKVIHSWNGETGSSPTVSPTLTAVPGKAGTPGKGSDGGQGGPGCILLFYTVIEEHPGGALMDSKCRFILDKFGRILNV